MANDKLVNDLLKALKRDNKVLVTRNANKIKIQLKGKAIEFEAKSRSERKRREVS